MRFDPKLGEKLYYARLSAAELAHARDKPFSDPACGKYLSDFGALLQMLPPPPRSVLDLGCGTGWTSILLARAGYGVTGVDISPEAVDVARQSATELQLKDVEFMVGDYEEMHFARTFDFVLFYDALHHAENEAKAIGAAYRALSDHGVLIAFEPGTGHESSPGAAHAKATFGVHEKDMPPHHIWRLGRRAGFRRWASLPSPHEIARAFYRRDYFQARTPFALVAERMWGYWRVATKTMRASRGGITMMWK